MIEQKLVKVDLLVTVLVPALKEHLGVVERVHYRPVNVVEDPQCGLRTIQGAHDVRPFAHTSLHSNPKHTSS